MLKQIILGTALALAGVSIAVAQTAPTDSHKNYDQKARDCKKLAVGQGLTGDALRSFIAECTKH